MTIQVEFYGIARQRTGVAACEFALPGESTTLGEVLGELATRYSAFGEHCCEGDYRQPNCRLRPDFIANIGGERFVRDPDTPLETGQTLLILSADAGG